MANKEVKYVKFQFETDPRVDADTSSAALSSMRFAVKTDDALQAVESSVKAARAIFGGLTFKCKSIDVSNYGD